MLSQVSLCFPELCPACFSVPKSNHPFPNEVNLIDPFQTDIDTLQPCISHIQARSNEFFFQPKSNQFSKWDIIDVRWLSSVLPLTAHQKSNVWASGQKRPDYKFAVRMHRLWSQRSRHVFDIFLSWFFIHFFIAFLTAPLAPIRS